MSPTEIEVLFEGTTEENALRGLCSEVRRDGTIVRPPICRHPIKFTNAGGKNKIPVALESALELLSIRPDAIQKLLVLLDLDDKVIDDCCRSIIGVVKRFASDAEFDLLSKEMNNVFTLRSGPSNLRLALHIASYRYQESFSIATTDDYVLDLAFREATAGKLLESCKRSDWTITADKLVGKIRSEIPDLPRSNGIALLSEAKEYVKLYGAVLSLAVSPNFFAAKTLKHAKEEDIREVFAALIAAIEYLGSES
jgi:hypothetical protein